MKIKILLFVAIGFLAYSCNSPKEESNESPAYESAEAEKVDMLARGEYLVDVGGCHHCHSPKIQTDKGVVLDPDRILSGHPANEALADYDLETGKSFLLFNMSLTATIGPWGTSFAGNLTPDDTGIGTWTEAQFINAIRKGKLKGLDGSRDLLPPMPWEDFAKMTDEDLKAIFAYLNTLKPVENIVPAPIPPQGAGQ
jgi:mono/diheme cytochrome c family protein